MENELDGRDYFLEFCTECSTKNEGYEVFCGTCGSNLKKSRNVVNQLNAKPLPTKPSQIGVSSIYPRTFARPQNQSLSKYSVTWDEGVSIALGATFSSIGISALIIYIVFFNEIVDELSSLLLVFVGIPIIIGYILLKPYMIISGMIKLAFGFAVSLALSVFFFIFVIEGFF